MSRVQRISAAVAAAGLLAGGVLTAWLLTGREGHPPARVVQVSAPPLYSPPRTPNPLAVRVKKGPYSTSSPSGTGLAAPDHLAGRRGLVSISLRWRPVRRAAGYIVYRDGKSVGQTTGTSFDDTRLQKGVPHTWTVAAVDRANKPGDLSAPLTR
ncbi:MAG: hypothetical protein QOE54_2938 [Streptosporangiaceae bacterium]|jgi:hypothetical protein|nr:cbhB 4 [Streptosporangiaceae bacterium]MDX6430572.1 hypothetical protein [Streptosporangiaceae bacterium]